MRTWEYNIHRYELCNRTEKMINKEILMKKRWNKYRRKGFDCWRYHAGTRCQRRIYGNDPGYLRQACLISKFIHKAEKESFFLFNCFYFCSFGRYDPFASPLLALIEAYTKPMMFFFLGTVAGGIPMMYQKARVQAFSWKLPVYVIGES